jgi:hypothetical protein
MPAKMHATATSPLKVLQFPSPAQWAKALHGQWRGLRRLCAWGTAAALSVTTVVLVSQTQTGAARLEHGTAATVDEIRNEWARVKAHFGTRLTGLRPLAPRASAGQAASITASSSVPSRRPPRPGGSASSSSRRARPVTLLDSLATTFWYADCRQWRPRA